MWFISTNAGQWSIKISQYSCEFNNLPPQGCTQWYFAKLSGIVRSFNYDGGMHLALQQQNICVRYLYKTTKKQRHGLAMYILFLVLFSQCNSWTIPYALTIWFQKELNFGIFIIVLRKSLLFQSRVCKFFLVNVVKIGEK